MNPADAHIIQRISLDVEFTGTDPMAIQERMTMFCRERISQRIEVFLDEIYTSPNREILDYLVLDLGTIEGEDWEERLLENLTERLADNLSVQLKQSVTSQSQHKLNSRPLEALYMYLENGSYPWWFSPNMTLSAWEKMLLPSLDERECVRLITWISQQPTVRKRLIQVFSPEFFERIISHHPKYKFWKTLWNWVVQVTEQKKEIVLPLVHLRRKYWEHILATTPVDQPLYVSHFQSTMGLIFQFLAQQSLSFGTNQTETNRKIWLQEAQKVGVEKVRDIAPLHLWLKTYTETHEAGSPSVNRETREMKDMVVDAQDVIAEAPVEDHSSLADEHLSEATRSQDQVAVPHKDQKKQEIPNVKAPDEGKGVMARSGKEEKKSSSVAWKKESLYVNYAGLILIHPFLAYFFERLGLWKEKKWVSEAAQRHAVQILAYVALGNTYCPEHDMVIAKLLCGLPIPEFVDPQLILSSEEIHETTALLSSVIEHWAVLKNTQIDGLREGFFQREGRVEFQGSQTVLTISQEAQDILLSRLPWGIGMIRLPWMEGFMQVNWT
ncbi:MAG: contractile injection system tape measure protein [Bacteroidota bacterium]